MKAILHNCCGLDVHKDSIVGCILKTSHFSEDGNKEEFESEIRVFGTFPKDLIELTNWVDSHNCRHVAMESSGVYWCPVYDALEEAFGETVEILVVNARHMKNVPGKKTDVKDAQWIAELLRAGLLRGSFIPSKEIRELRDLTRYRKNVVEDITRQKNRIEKELQKAGFKLSTFLSDVFGVSGRNLINVLLKKGKLSSHDVETETKRISQEKKDAIKRALTSKLSEHQRNFIKMLLKHLDDLLANLKEVEQLITEMSSPYQEDVERLDTIPGIAKTSATAIIAEIGTDMSKFPTAEHFCSWAGVSPGNNESAGKKKSTRITHGNPYIKGLVVECAWSITRMHNTYLSNYYYKIKQRSGSKKAIVALARKLLVIIYHLLKNKDVYNEEKFELTRQKQESLRLKRISSEAKKLGFCLVSLDAS